MKHDGRRAKEKIGLSTDLLASRGGRPRGSTKVRMTLFQAMEIGLLVGMHDRDHREMDRKHFVEQRPKVGVHAQTVGEATALFDSMHSPLAPKLKKLATAWHISERTAWNYYRTIRDAKDGFSLRTAEEVKTGRVFSKFARAAGLEFKTIAPDSVKRVLFAYGDLYPSDAPDVAKLFFELFDLRYDLVGAGPSRAHDIRCKMDAIAAEIEVAASIAGVPRKQVAKLA